MERTIVDPNSINNLCQRAEIAKSMMQGLISHYGGANPDSMAKMAIECADALIDRLNKNK